MIALHVEAVSGHYGVPGQVSQGATRHTLPVVPPSTVQGFLESFVGASYRTFEGAFAYGRIRPPTGRGLILRQAHVWASPRSVKENKRARDAVRARGVWVSGGKESRGDREGTRTIKIETLIDPSYCILVDGPWESRVRAALDGKGDCYGVLYLGESSDIVHWVGEMLDPTDQVEWLVPGTEMVLPTKAARGYHNMDSTYGTFDLRVGRPAWMGGSK